MPLLLANSELKATVNSELFSAHNALMKYPEYAARFKRSWKESKTPVKTQKELAKLLGVAQATVSDWINGEKLPSMDTAIEISKKLDCCVVWLLTGNGLKRLDDKQQPSPLLDKFNQLCPEQQQIIELMVDQLSNKPKSSENKENKPLTARPENVGGGVNLPDPLASYRRRRGDEPADKDFIAAVQRDYEDSK